MNASFAGVSIRAIASALPAQTLCLKDLAGEFGEQEVRRIIRSTGIESVRLAGDLRTSDLCESAALSLFAALQVPADAIDAIVLVTQTPDFVMPATSALLQHRLGLRRDCVAFDINYGCSGYIYGLYQAAMLIAAGGCGRVLVCTGDVISKLLDPRDRNVRMVFGDAAAATLVERGEHSMEFAFQTDGGGYRHLHTPLLYADGPEISAQSGRLYMDGAEIMNFALGSVPPAIDLLLGRLGLHRNDVPLFALHQANSFMLRYLARTLSIPERKVPVQIKDVGNTGPSSIPLAMSIGVDGTDFRQDGVVACGFGVGLSVAVARLPLADVTLLPPVDVTARRARPN